MFYQYNATYNIFGAVELTCNGTESGRNYRLVEGHEENGNAQREHCQSELQCAGVFWLCGLLAGRVMLLFSRVLQTVTLLWQRLCCGGRHCAVVGKRLLGRVPRLGVFSRSCDHDVVGEGESEGKQRCAEVEAARSLASRGVAGTARMSLPLGKKRRG